MTWALPGAGTQGDLGAGDRAAAATRALGRAEEAVSVAARHLVDAGGVEWAGAGAAGYRDDLAAALAGVRLLRAGLGEAQAAAGEHAAAVREHEALAGVTGSTGALASAAWRVPALELPRRWGTVP